LGQMHFTEYFCKTYFDCPIQPDSLRSCTHTLTQCFLVQFILFSNILFNGIFQFHWFQ